jgi:hypothetical protein
MNQKIKLLIIISFLLLIIDIPMITKFNYEMYNKQLLRINGNKWKAMVGMIKSAPQYNILFEEI